MSETTLHQRLQHPETIRDEDALAVLNDDGILLDDLLDWAFAIRKKHFGTTILVHILNNVQNGGCPEDCGYCAQSKNAKTPIVPYSFKDEDEVLKEAEAAHRRGAHRTCLVFAGRGPSPAKTRRIAAMVKRIKERFPIEVCVSAGLLTRSDAALLKQAGVDRINHNINTAPSYYHAICSTHTFEDRLATLQAAQEEGVGVCSGVIIGMGERPHHIVEMARILHRHKVESLPVNFFLPLPGVPLERHAGPLTPEYCLRVLCLFRFFNPSAELRVAAGREYHLKDKQILAFKPANSLFIDGYLNAEGDDPDDILTRLKHAGYTLQTSAMEHEPARRSTGAADHDPSQKDLILKTHERLRPYHRS